VDEEEEEEEWRLEEITLRRRQMAFQRKRRDEGSLGSCEEEAEEEVQLRLEEIGIRRRKRERERERERQRKPPVLPSAGSLREDVVVEVPISPPPPAKQEKPDPVSPARRRLGLDSAPQAARVSLKRARDGNPPRAPRDGEAPRPKSFGERLREGMREVEEREERLERRERARTGGFHRVEEEGGGKRAAAGRGSASQGGGMVGRSASILSSTIAQQPLRAKARGLFNTSGSRSREGDNSDADLSISPSPRPQTVDHHDPTNNDHDDKTSAPDDPTATPSYDPFSRIHLSKRRLPHPVVARHLQDKTPYTLPELLKDVRAPHYDPPEFSNDSGGDFVLFAILASKSTPHDQKPSHHTHGGGEAGEEALQGDKKFMVLKLCDLKWDIDLFLFGPAFTRFWKLTPGTLLAILNPGILPPKPGAPAGAPFCLKLASSEDTILEIGVARDLAFCSATRKDGRQCDAWVDGRRTGVCDFHLDLFVERQRRGRMEVNTMSRTNRNPNPAVARGEARRGGGGPSYAVPPSSSTARLLDMEDRHLASSRRETDASRQRLAAAQKERELRRALERLPGSNPGKEYLSLRTQSVQNQAGAGSDVAAGGLTNGRFSAAGSLGLRGGKKAEEVRLSPPKERKAHFGLSGIGMGKEAVGWGGGIRKLPAAKAAEVPTGGGGSVGGKRGRSASPVKKKARFVLEGKGIREPGGRESGGLTVGGVVVGLKMGDDDDDDGLEIV